jgi:hypothetical protein
VPRVDAVRLVVGRVQLEQIRVLLPHLGVQVRYEFTDVLANERTYSSIIDSA